MDDILINYGSEVKAMGNGRVGGYLVTFGDETTPDLSEHRDFFTPSETDYDIEDGAKTTMYFHHGLDKKLGVTKLGKVEMKTDEVGIWAEGILALRDEYEKTIYQMCESGKLSWSSGATTHLVRREKVAGKNASRVTNWPISEASLTPTPADSRNLVMAIKSASFDVNAYDTMSGVKSALGDMTPDVAASAFDRLSSKLSSFVYQKLWRNEWGGYSYGPMNIGGLAADTPIDREAIAQALDEYSTTVLAVLDALLALPKADPVSVKTFLSQFNPANKNDALTLLSSMPIKTYLETMGAVVSDSDRRLTWYAEQREIKQGRTISAGNLTEMTAICDGMDTCASNLDEHRKNLRAMIEMHGAVPDTNNGKSAPLVHEALQAAYASHLAFQARGGTITL